MERESAGFSYSRPSTQARTYRAICRLSAAPIKASEPPSPRTTLVPYKVETSAGLRIVDGLNWLSLGRTHTSALYGTRVIVSDDLHPDSI